MKQAFHVAFLIGLALYAAHGHIQAAYERDVCRRDAAMKAAVDRDPAVMDLRKKMYDLCEEAKKASAALSEEHARACDSLRITMQTGKR